MPKRITIPQVDRERQRDIIATVRDTAMHILHDSYLPRTNLWPKNGFKSGHGIGCRIKDCVYIGVNAWVLDAPPITGRLYLNIWNTEEKRREQQAEHIKIILDFAYSNNLYFEDEFKKTSPTDYLWFKFTYTPTN
ncbi:MAG: hypothetical protein ABIN91_10925 [Mucilaginibacter sp.]|uniref:hypothetical protein n=1 Tax=Mucilaginibacter sp. TaxID=1882438 RepID=UPI00326729A4